METGALGIYVGNGLSLLHEIGVNVADKFILLGTSYDVSHAPDIVKSVKDLLLNPLDAMRRWEAPAFKRSSLPVESLDLSKLQAHCLDFAAPARPALSTMLARDVVARQ